MEFCSQLIIINYFYEVVPGCIQINPLRGGQVNIPLRIFSAWLDPGRKMDRIQATVVIWVVDPPLIIITHRFIKRYHPDPAF